MAKGAKRPFGAVPGRMAAWIGRHVSFFIFAVLAVLATLCVRNFAARDNLVIILKQSAIPAVACIGMTMVLMTGGIDLSLGYIVGLASIIAGILAKTLLLRCPRWCWPCCWWAP